MPCRIVGPVADMCAERFEKRDALIPTPQVLAADVGGEDSECCQLARLVNQSRRVYASSEDRFRFCCVVVPAAVKKGIEIHRECMLSIRVGY